MARAKAPIYDQRFFRAMQGELNDLREVCTQLREYAPKALSEKLDAAMVVALGKSLEATKPIFKTGVDPIGFGVRKAEKAIACDHAIAIIRQIKALKAW
jgi:hypothetical protein